MRMVTFPFIKSSFFLLFGQFQHFKSYFIFYIELVSIDFKSG